MKPLAILFALLLPAVALGQGTNRVTLAWDATADSISGYKLYYGTTSGQYQQSNVVNAATVTSTPTNLLGGQKYFFAVTAFNEFGESRFSSEISYVVPLAAPGGLRIPAVLQQASSLPGPWTDYAALGEATIPTDGSNKFYRVLLTVRNQ